MEAPQAAVWKRPEVLVPVLSSVVLAALLIGLELIALVTGQAGFFGIIIIVTGVLFLLAAGLVWKGRRSGYALGIVLSAIWFVLLLFTGASAFSSFADQSTFLTSIIGFPAFILVIVYSALGIRSRGKGAMPIKPTRMIPVSSFFALVTLGFIIGAAVIGILAAGVVTGLVNTSNVKADVTIVVGASNNGVAQPFSPGNLTVKIGTTVTWINKDPVAHTVTSSSVPNGAATFDSGVILYGYTFSMKFIHAGVYQYYCTIHPSMTGTIVVTS
ncbi:MAG TPA: plastocyanin/azurin family copper-binding protein [Nitrososphaerales archaeon]|nr:plastocyanin/azurin family copper-binding protein [Nitrososphaerales archaeon]